MSTKWADLYTDGRRINRIIRYLETRMKKCDDDDRIIKYANSIGFLTSKKIEIIDIVTGVRALLNMGKKNHPEVMKHRYDKENLDGPEEKS